MCSHVFHVSCAQVSYMLTCLRHSFTSFFFTFEKLSSKNLYIEKFLLLQRSIQTHLIIYEGVFCEKKMIDLHPNEFYTHFIFVDTNLKTISMFHNLHIHAQFIHTFKLSFVGLITFCVICLQPIYCS